MATETTIEADDASRSRIASYAVARRYWQNRPKEWSQATKTAAYEALTRLWFAMTGAEQASEGLRSRLAYH